MSERIERVTVVEKLVHKLAPGEATFEEATKTWYVGCPGERCGIANLGNHTVSYDAVAREITVVPSILCYSCGSHYFIERNAIRWA